MNEARQIVEFTVEQGGERLDKTLAAGFEQLSRAQIQALIHDEMVWVDGRVVKPSYRLEGGETIRVSLPLPTSVQEPQPEMIPLDILFENDQVVVINKPAGLIAHPAAGHTSGTLVNAVLARWPQVAKISEPERAGIVHRLDKDTSGVIVVAKTQAALESLRTQFKSRTIRKRYLALVEGVPDTPDGVVNAPVGRDPAQRKRMAVIRDGREAITEFHILEQYTSYSLLEVFPRTGRTHQIRVHLAFIGHPVVGDTVYGRRKQSLKLKRHFLHAASITFALPDSEQMITVEAPLPKDLQTVLDDLLR